MKKIILGLSLFFAAITVSQTLLAGNNNEGQVTGVEGIVSFSSQSAPQQYQSFLPPFPALLEGNKMGLVGKIEGRWKHGQSDTNIKLQGNHYVFCNEDNDCADGYSVIFVPKWNVTGVMSKDGRTIIWSNGTRWERR